MLTLYGLKTCDTCRKAKAWLEAEKVPFSFVDLRTDPPSRERLAEWIADLGSARVLNKASTTWRSLSEEEKHAEDDVALAEVLHAHPALIKRPVFERKGKIETGFKPADREALKRFVRG